MELYINWFNELLNTQKKSLVRKILITMLRLKIKRLLIMKELNLLKLFENQDLDIL